MESTCIQSQACSTAGEIASPDYRPGTSPRSVFMQTVSRRDLVTDPHREVPSLPLALTLPRRTNLQV
ncbi:hypothetical protein ACRRTK_016318 [Alexandromys fortis]